LQPKNLSNSRGLVTLRCVVKSRQGGALSHANASWLGTPIIIYLTCASSQPDTKEVILSISRKWTDRNCPDPSDTLKISSNKKRLQVGRESFGSHEKEFDAVFVFIKHAKLRQVYRAILVVAFPSCSFHATATVPSRFARSLAPQDSVTGFQLVFSIYQNDNLGGWCWL
jgi:hypothetical protein